MIVRRLIGFSHGSSTLDIKTAEIGQVIENKAKEVDLVGNIGKALNEE